MNDNTNYFKIGLFVIGAVVVAVLAVIVLGGGDLFRQEVLVETYFDESVQGLEIGSPLKLRGITVGQVREITTARWVYDTTSNLVMVVAAVYGENVKGATAGQIENKCTEMISQGMRVRLASQGLTGIVYLEADFYEPDRFPERSLDWTPKHLHVPSAPSNITRLGESLERILNNLEAINVSKITKHLDELIVTLQGKIASADVAGLNRQLESLLGELRSTNTRINRLVSDKRTEQLLSDATAAVSGARRIVEAAESPVADTLAALPEAGKNLKQLTAHANNAARELPGLVRQVQTAVDRIDRLVVSERRDIQVILNNMREVTNNLEALTQSARQYPSRVFFGGPPSKAKAGSK